MDEGHRTKLPPYRVSLAGTLLAAREAVMAPIRPKLRAANITEQQWRVLRVLADKGPTDASGVAQEAILNPPSLSRILKELGDRRLIERETHANDGRRSIVAITSTGLDLVDSTAAHTVEVLNRYSEIFGSERLARLCRDLQELASALEQCTD